MLTRLLFALNRFRCAHIVGLAMCAGLFTTACVASALTSTMPPDAAATTTASPTAIETARPTNTPAPTQTPAATSTSTPTATPANLAIRPIPVPADQTGGLSADGRYVLFLSMSTDLIKQPASPDILRVFLYDREAYTTTLVSATADGEAADWQSAGAVLAADGSTIAFWSFAGNLAGEDVQDCPGIGPDQVGCGSLYIYDVPTGALERIPVGAPHGLGMVAETALSADGRYVAFATNGGALWDGTMLLDRVTGEIIQVSASALAVDLSADGRFVAFASNENDLVPGDLNEAPDVFVLDRKTGEIERVSAPLDGQGANQPSGASYFTEGISAGLDISPDGRYVVFESSAPDLVEADLMPCTMFYGKELPVCRHVYLHDRDTDATELISLSDGGSPGDHVSQGASVSPDGRLVVFTSFAGNLIPQGPIKCAGYSQGNCPAVFVRDRKMGRTHLVSAGWDGALPNGWSFGGTLSPDGRHLLFRSSADNLAPGVGGGTFIADLLKLLGEE